MTESRKRLALVTGASRGIGRATALRLAQMGYRVVINYVQNRAAAEEVERMIAEQGGESLICQFDVSDREHVASAIKELARGGDVIDVLVNNAAAIRDQPLVRMRDEDWDFVLATNLNGVYHCTKAVLKTWAGGKRGSRIISISSIAAEMGRPYDTSYAASKAGIIGFSKSLASELAPKGVTVNVIAPGYIYTDAIAAYAPISPEAICEKVPLKRIGRPEEVAHVVAMLVAPDGGYITGQVIAIDGGIYNLRA